LCLTKNKIEIVRDCDHFLFIMKRTRETCEKEEDESPLYMDPVTRTAPVRPLVLTQCGHTIDQSYLDQLEKRAKETKNNNKGYCCLVCDQVSSAVVRNFALEVALKLDNVEGPARIVVPPLVQPLHTMEEFADLSKELNEAIAGARNRPQERYKDMCKYVLEKEILPLVKRGGFSHCSDAIRCEDMSSMFWNWQNILEWLDYENGRYETEFSESHNLRIHASLYKFDDLLTEKKNGSSCKWFYSRPSPKSDKGWYTPCTREEFKQAPLEERVGRPALGP